MTILMAHWHRASARVQDGLTAAGTFLVGLALNLLGLARLYSDGAFGPLAVLPAWWQTVFLAVGCAAMLFKRRRPVLALLVGAFAFVADLSMGGSVAMVLVLFDLLFAAGMWATPRARTAVMTAVVVVIGTSGVVGGLALGDFRATIMIGLQLTGMLGVPLWWATNLRQQHELGALTTERATREAVHAERAAMARELHDVIASHLSTTAIHSGGALALPPDTERDRAALRAVRASSLAALDEMRTMILLLRAEAGGSEAVVPSGLEKLPDLVETARVTGLDVTVQAEAPQGIPALVNQAGYRILREALTNAAKHAPGSRVWVALSSTGDQLEVAVTNTLTKPAGHEALGAGAGLAGMAERAALLGGKVSAGREGDLWRVLATLPLRNDALVTA